MSKKEKEVKQVIKVKDEYSKVINVLSANFEKAAALFQENSDLITAFMKNAVEIAPESSKKEE